MDDAFLEFRKRAEDENGAYCTGCRCTVKAYDHVINSPMARQLIALRRKSGNEFPFIHTSEMLQKGQSSTGNFTKLRFWGLIEPFPEEEKKGQPKGEKKSSGMWRITQAGKDFVDRKMKVLKHKWTYDNEVYKTVGPYVGIEECLTVKFDYGALMRGEQ